MSSSLITPLVFNGQSKYSSDYQQILNRAVQVQSIHLSQLTDTQRNEQNTQTSLQALDTLYAGLSLAISNVNSSMGASSYSASVANPSVATVSLGQNVTTGVYNLEVQHMGSQSLALSGAGAPPVTDPTTQNLNSSPSFTLSITNNDVSPATTSNVPVPAASSLSALVQYINANSTLGVSASTVNVGSSSSPDYRLSLQSTKLGNLAIQMTDSSNNPLLSSVGSAGSLTTYSVDGQTAVNTSSNSVTLAPGVSLNLQSANLGSPTTISINQTTNSVQSALQGLATSYNSVVDNLATQHGQNAGALAGDPILYAAQSAMEQINSYATTLNGQPAGLTSIGLDLDTSGHLNFNASEFQSSAGASFQTLTAFLGNNNSGFIQAASTAVTGLNDPTNGSLTLEENTLAASLTKAASDIAAQVTFVNNYQQNLFQQLAASDAQVATLASQTTFFQNLYSYTYNNNSNG